MRFLVDESRYVALGNALIPGHSCLKFVQTKYKQFQ
jgi:hypothetical protein